MVTSEFRGRHRESLTPPLPECLEDALKEARIHGGEPYVVEEDAGAHRVRPGARRVGQDSREVPTREPLRDVGRSLLRGAGQSHKRGQHVDMARQRPGGLPPLHVRVDHDHRHVNVLLVGDRPLVPEPAVRAAELPVVGGEDHHGVLPQVEVVERVQHLSDVPVVLAKEAQVVVVVSVPHVPPLGRDLPHDVGGPPVELPVGARPPGRQEGLVERAPHREVPLLAVLEVGGDRRDRPWAQALLHGLAGRVHVGEEDVVRVDEGEDEKPRLPRLSKALGVRAQPTNPLRADDAVHLVSLVLLPCHLAIGLPDVEPVLLERVGVVHPWFREHDVPVEFELAEVRRRVAEALHRGPDGDGVRGEARRPAEHHLLLDPRHLRGEAAVDHAARRRADRRRNVMVREGDTTGRKPVEGRLVEPLRPDRLEHPLIAGDEEDVAPSLVRRVGVDRARQRRQPAENSNHDKCTAE